MYSATGFMQNALPVLHNALRLPSLRNANHLKLMESVQVDGILPRARLWNICDSPNVIDAAKVRWIQVGRARRGDMKEWNEYKVCLVEYNTSCYWLSLLLLLNKGWKMLCTAMCTRLNELKEAMLQGNIWIMRGTIPVYFSKSFFHYKMPSQTIEEKKSPEHWLAVNWVQVWTVVASELTRLIHSTESKMWAL